MVQICNMVLEVFFHEPTRHHYLKEISRKAHLAHTSVKKNLDELKKDDLIIEFSEIKGSRIFPLYKANQNNPDFRRQKIYYNQEQIKHMIDYLTDKLMPKCIILFGSYARGEDNEESDIDLYLQCAREEVDLMAFDVGRKVQLHFRQDFSGYPKELRNNIVNGIVVHGYLEAF